MMKDREPAFARDLFLQHLDVLVFEFDDFSAAGADQMIVVVHVIDEFIAGVAAAKLMLLREAALAEEVECSIDGGKADGPVDLLDLLVEFLGGDVPLGLQKHLEDHISLLGNLEVVLGDVFLKNLFLVSPGGHVFPELIMRMSLNINKREHPCQEEYLMPGPYCHWLMPSHGETVFVQ
jgi:hypothetical protein